MSMRAIDSNVWRTRRAERECLSVDDERIAERMLQLQARERFGSTLLVMRHAHKRRERRSRSNARASKSRTQAISALRYMNLMEQQIESSCARSAQRVPFLQHFGISILEPSCGGFRLHKIRQRFDRARLDDPQARCDRSSRRSTVLIRPGARIAIAAGSRGIDNLAAVVRDVSDYAEGARRASVRRAGDGQPWRSDGRRAGGDSDSRMASPKRRSARRFAPRWTSSSCRAETRRCGSSWIVTSTSPTARFSSTASSRTPIFTDAMKAA